MYSGEYTEQPGTALEEILLVLRHRHLHKNGTDIIWVVCGGLTVGVWH